VPVKGSDEMNEKNIQWGYDAYVRRYFIYDEVYGNIEDIIIFADRTVENDKEIEKIVAALDKLFTPKGE
jgi:hypothetical protein